MEKVSLPNQLEGDRIILRRHEIDFAEKIFHSVDSNRARLREFLPWVDFTTNSRSISVAKKNGYHLEATLREDMLQNGIRRSTHVFAKLKSETLSFNTKLS